jgi:hypothetical protein
MVSPFVLVCKLLLNPGVLDVPLPVFLVSQVVVLVVPDKVLTVTCVVVVVCSLLTRPGDAGTERSALAKDDMLYPLR